VAGGATGRDAGVAHRGVRELGAVRYRRRGNAGTGVPNANLGNSTANGSVNQNQNQTQAQTQAQAQPQAQPE